MTVEVNENVLGLEISIHDLMRVKMLKSKDNLSNNYSGIVLRKSLVLAQVKEKLTSRAKLKHEVKILFGSKRLDKLTDERML